MEAVTIYNSDFEFLEKVKNTFVEYAYHHLAKNTDESLLKARRNVILAEEMLEFINKKKS